MIYKWKYIFSVQHPARGHLKQQIRTETKIITELSNISYQIPYKINLLMLIETQNRRQTVSVFFYHLDLQENEENRRIQSEIDIQVDVFKSELKRGLAKYKSFAIRLLSKIKICYNARFRAILAKSCIYLHFDDAVKYNEGFFYNMRSLESVLNASVLMPKVQEQIVADTRERNT